jgi:hypothetical protein
VYSCRHALLCRYGKAIAPEFRGSAEGREGSEREPAAAPLYTTEGPEAAGLFRRRRRSSAATALYESIRTQGRVSRQASEQGLAAPRPGLARQVLTRRLEALRTPGPPPPTPPRPKALWPRASTSGPRPTSTYSDMDMRETYSAV